MIAEIQQSSDVTYRLYDWNRVGLDGQPRPLHIDAGLEAIDFTLGPIDPLRPRLPHSSETTIEPLVACDKFVLERWRMRDTITVPHDERCRILHIVDGALTCHDDSSSRPWTRGETGYPVVDAAMRELWATGYMHNRARMIAAGATTVTEITVTARGDKLLFLRDPWSIPFQFVQRSSPLL